MKVYYFNDRKTAAHVRTRADAGSEQGIWLTMSLAPATGYLFEIKVPDGHAPWIKVWETNQVMIDSIDPKVLETKDA